MAWHAAPLGLFKFRPYGSEWRPWVDSIVQNGEVKFTPLGEFDDPFEGRPYAEAAHEDPEKQLYAMRRAHVRAQMKQNGVPKKLAERQSAMITKEWCRDQVGRVQSTMRDELSRDCQVLSLSATRNHPILWSLYADMHRGVCIHFDTTIDPVSIAMQVTYSVQYARLPVPRWGFQTDEELLEQCALVKATWWKDQQEFRLLRVQQSDKGWTDLGVSWNGQLAKLPARSVCGVTLGARISSDARADLIAVCAGRNPSLPVFQAQLAEREFALTFEQIA